MSLEFLYGTLETYDTIFKEEEMEENVFTARDELDKYTVGYTFDLKIHKEDDLRVQYNLVHGITYLDPIYNKIGMCIGYSKPEVIKVTKTHGSFTIINYDIINNDNILKFIKVGEPKPFKPESSFQKHFDRFGNDITHPEFSGYGHFVMFNGLHRGTTVKLEHNYVMEVELEVMINNERFVGKGKVYYYREEGSKQYVTEPITVLGANLRHNIEVLGENNYHDADKYLYGMYGIKKEDVAITNTKWVDEETYVLKSVEMKDGTIHELNKTLAKRKYANEKGA